MILPRSMCQRRIQPSRDSPTDTHLLPASVVKSFAGCRSLITPAQYTRRSMHQERPMRIGRKDKCSSAALLPRSTSPGMTSAGDNFSGYRVIIPETNVLVEFVMKKTASRPEVARTPFAHMNQRVASLGDYVLLVSLGVTVNLFESRNPLHDLTDAVHVERLHSESHGVLTNLGRGNVFEDQLPNFGIHQH